MRRILPPLLVTVFLISQARSAAAQEDLQKRVDQLGQRIAQLEAKQRQPVTEVHQEAAAIALFLFGAFCALWAQNTNRNPWLWFFLGLFFNIITVLFLLVKNSDDRRQARGEPAAAGCRVAVAYITVFLVILALAAFILWWEH
jgi:hypothetical protein